MTDELKTLSVSIMDKDFQVACPAGEQDKLLRSAHYLHEQMRAIRSTGKVVGLDRIAIMAALNIANELLHGEGRAEIADEDVRTRVRVLTDKIKLAISDGRQLKI